MGFLAKSSFDVQFFIEYSGSDSYARAYLVGLLNTLLVSILESLSVQSLELSLVLRDFHQII